MAIRTRRFSGALLTVLAAVTLGTAGLVVAAPANSAPSSPIKHVVVLYLENHSFDSILGFWCHDNPGRCPQGGMPSSVTLADGVTLTPSVEPDIVPAVNHSVAAQQKALANNWDQIANCTKAQNYRCIGGYTPAQQPNTTTLATKFAINDNTFSMADSPSWGGHLYAVMGQTDGFTGDNPPTTPGTLAGWGCDSDKLEDWAPAPGAPTQKVPSCIPDPSLDATQYPNGGAFEPTPVKYAPTIMDRLDKANLSWKLYGLPDQPSGSAGVANGYGWDICPSFAECLDTSQHDHNVQSSDFVNDAQNGNLPNFSVVTPGGATAPASEHNGTSMTVGDDWIGQVANAVMSGPEWKSTALFITWDDCGCFYDQVKPGTNPDGTPQGPRSPLIVVSPYAKSAYTDHKHATFVSILAYVEHNFALPPLGPNDNGAYDFADIFDYDQTPLKAAHTVWRKYPADAYHINKAELEQDT